MENKIKEKRKIMNLMFDIFNLEVEKFWKLKVKKIKEKGNSLEYFLTQLLTETSLKWHDNRKTYNLKYLSKGYKLENSKSRGYRL